MCERPSCRALADEVDHIKPVGVGGDRYDWANMASQCAACHLAKTSAEALAARRSS
ncbi:HNH endonuclease [Nocardia brasiliensis]|uniref:HNH endonuclease n=1 Tax=Nocardia brasiliensis TaxID=37326 RepID=UPI00366F4E89